MRLKVSHGEASHISTEITPLNEGTLYITYEGNMYADLNGQRIQIGGNVSQQQIVNTIYPVGSIYTSVNSTNPSVLFGFGEWEQIQDCFLLAAGDTYQAGTTGGEASHTLTIDELPSHSHENNYPAVSPINGSGSSSGYAWQMSSDDWGYQSDKSVGGEQPHNNMPPYLTVYVWKRIS